jgi:hypothetical protein
MAEKNAIFGLFAGGNAGKVFKELGITAQKTSKDTSSLAMAVEKASIRMESASKKELDAQGKVKLAQIELNRVRASGVPQEKELTVAEERLASAQRASVLATTENSRATKALAASEIEANAAATHLHKGFLGLSSSTVPLGHRLKSTTKLIGGMALGFGAFKAFQFGKQSLTAAEEFQASQTKLRVAIGNTGHSMSEFQKPIAAVNDKLGKWGFTTAETQSALAILTTGLRSPTKALSLMALTADLARARNMDLSESALLITKAQHGQLRGTKALGIDAGIAASGILQQRVATVAYNKELAKNRALHHQTGTAISKTTVHMGTAAKARERLNHLEAKYGDVSRRTISQQAQIAKAQDAVTKATNTTTTSSTKYVDVSKQIAASDAKLIELRNKKTAADQAGSIQVEAINKAIGGSAAKQAQDDYAIKQKVLAKNFNDIKVALGNELLPKLTQLTDWMNKDGMRDIKVIGGFFHDWGKEIAIVGGSLGAIFIGSKIGAGVTGLISIMKPLVGLFRTIEATAAGAAVAEAAASEGLTLGPALAAAATMALALGVGGQFAFGSGVTDKKTVAKVKALNDHAKTLPKTDVPGSRAAFDDFGLRNGQAKPLTSPGSPSHKQPIRVELHLDGKKVAEVINPHLKQLATRVGRGN